MKADAGAYIHFPFCVKKCAYCDFYSLRHDPAVRERYISALEKHIGRYAGTGRALDSVYFGGGTPSLASADDINRILAALDGAFGISDGCEISLELNPGTADGSKLLALKKAGVTRLSVGVQSFDPAELSALGRIHGPREALELLEAAREIFDSLSCDLMYGIPLQTLDSLGASTAAAVRAGVGHISLYGLKIEPSTPFYASHPPLPDEETERQMYFSASQMLEDMGFRRYEISNFARPGRECRHNLKYWTSGEWFGFGPSAASRVGRRRYAYARDLAGYIDAVEKGEGPPVSEDIALSKEDAAQERIMMALRLADGMELSDDTVAYSALAASDTVGRLVEEGFMTLTPERAALTGKGFYVSNAIICEILEIREKTHGGTL